MNSKTRLAKTIDYCKSLKPEQINGTEDKEIVVKFSSGERKFTGQAFLLNFCLPNFYFHATTAYDILRHCGIELGKRDFMGTPVNLRVRQNEGASANRPASTPVRRSQGRWWSI